MSVPARNERGKARIADWLYEFGSVDLPTLKNRMRKVIGGDWSNTSRSIDLMVADGQIIADDNGIHSISDEVFQWCRKRKDAMKPPPHIELVKPRTAPPFREWRAEMYTGLRDRIRDITLKNGLQTPVAFHKMEDAE
jgi:hypothetical protein